MMMTSIIITHHKFSDIIEENFGSQNLANGSDFAFGEFNFGAHEAILLELKKQIYLVNA